jgi:hypothetical protein
MPHCTVLFGGQNAVNMAEWVKVKEGFLRDFLKLTVSTASPAGHCAASSSARDGMTLTSPVSLRCFEVRLP